MPALSDFFADESGATAIEYGLIAAATGLALIATMPTIGTNLSAKFNSLGTGLNN
jgi:pilus assembly protein Flp/PilA